MENYYDVMYSESYDWWTLAMAFNTNQNTIDQLSIFEYTGVDDMGIAVNAKGNRVVVTILCRMNSNILMDGDNYGYHDYADYWEEDDDSEEEVDAGSESNDYLLNLLTKNREYLNKGDYRLLYGIMKKFGYQPEDEDELLISPEQINNLPPPVKKLIDAIEFE